MSGEKLKLVKETMKFVVSNLTDSDNIAIVTYDSNVKTLQELTAMTKNGKEKTLQLISGIQAGSSTDLCGIFYLI